MQSLALLTLVLAATSIQGRPLTKRIAQVISDSTTQWENACVCVAKNVKLFR